MQYVPLGSTGLEVSRIGLGLAALGRPGYLNIGHGADLAGHTTLADLETHTHTILDEGYEAGVRYFDAARSYGRAEEFLTTWIAGRGLTPARITVGSKWGYTYTANWSVDVPTHEVKDHSLATLDRQFHESVGLLGEQMDLYQIHSATIESGVLENGAVLDRLAELRARGVAMGVSTSGPSQAATIRRALEISRNGAPLFQAVQATWNLLEPSAGSALSEAHEAGIGVIVKEPLANGRLTGRNARLPPGLRDVDWPPDALALAVALDQPWVDVVLSGAATPGQLRSNMRALSVPQRTLARVRVEPEEPDRYWQQRSELRWT